MTWIRADNLQVGDKTCGGLAITDITVTGPLITVTWKRGSERAIIAQYFPDQTFDMAQPGPTTQEETPMAQRVNITVESDLSGKGDASTVTFGLDGQTYEVDLTDNEQSKLRDVLAPYVGAGRTVGKNKRKATAQSGPSARAIREWAQENGVEVPERGRIPADVRSAYDAAH